MRLFQDLFVGKKRDWVVCLLLAAASLFVYSRSLSVHGLEYRDDEIFYFQSTREMLAERDFLSPTYFGENRFQKPILYYWLILLSYVLFGVDWFAARLVAVVFAAGSVCLTYLTAGQLVRRRTALLSSLILMTTPLFFRHAKNAVPDMALNFFIVLAVYAAIRFARFSDAEALSSRDTSAARRFRVLFFLACGLGFMVKGFAALIIPCLTVIIYALSARRSDLLRGMKFGQGGLILAAVVLPWFVFMLLKFGKPYLDYMIVAETKTRLLGDHGLLFDLMTRVQEFGGHAAFYVRVLLSYFAPWGWLIVPGFLSVAWAGWQDPRIKNSLRWFWTWFWVVFLFFSFMDFRINHYLMVLSTPFVILIGYFLEETFLRGQPWLERGMTFFKRDFLTFVFCAGNLAFGFLLVFLAGASPLWLAVLLLFTVGTVRLIYTRSDRPAAAAWAVALFILFGLTQTTLMGKAGVTAHSPLQRLAQIVHEQMDETSVVAVGSQDIHEKEWQIYFETRVEQAGLSYEDGTRGNLRRIFSSENAVFCLMTESDYAYYLKDLGDVPPRVIQEDYIFRRRMAIDRGFFEALIRLDRRRIHDYLMEKIVLVKKESHPPSPNI